jgi:WhiB family transcriptional regulator, redox-sensing transcriptional regulator
MRVLPMSAAWQDRAACKGHQPDLWYPDGMQGQNDAYRYAAARVVCDTCPVKADCLAHAIANDERHGMWGGLTPTERKALAKGRRRSEPDIDVGLPADTRQCDTCTDTAVSGEAMCARCLTESGIEDWDRTQHDLDVNRKNKRAQRQRARDAGLCTKCCCRPRAESFVQCHDCLARARAYDRRVKANRLGITVEQLVACGAS